VLLEAVLEGGAPRGFAEVNVIWETAVPEAGEPTGETADRSRLAFPNREHPSSIVALDDQGACRIPLIVPRQTRMPNVIIRYCGRKVSRSDPARLLVLAPAPIGRVVTQQPDTTPSQPSPTYQLDRGSAAKSQHPIVARIPVAVDVAFLQWTN
jgi:hypothetical protein